MSHSDGTIETLVFHAAEPDEFDFDELEIDNPHPNTPIFIEQRNGWRLVLVTDRGFDNGYGSLFLDPVHGFICAENGYDDLCYALNVARDMAHVMELWEQYRQIGQSYEGGFVDWIMSKAQCKYYSDIRYGADPLGLKIQPS
jgi:hypothetical protein